MALRLIAYAQNGIRVDENSILSDIPVGLPKFEYAEAPVIKAAVSDDIWRITAEDR